MDTLIQDFRYAARSLAKSPVLSAAAVITLGLGIGANTAMFGVVDRLFFRPPAYVQDPARVVRLYVRQYGMFATGAGSGEGQFTGPVGAYPRYRDFRDHATSFSAVAAFVDSRVAVGRGATAERVAARLVTASLFPLLGIRAELGRFFTTGEDREGAAAHVIVLADHYWRSRFGGDSSVLGRAVPLGRDLYTIVGVAPAGFTGVDLDVPDVWLPLTAMADAVMFPGVLECGGCGWLGTIARLAPGVTPAQAAAEGTALFRAIRHPNAGADSTAVVSLGSVHDALGPMADSSGKLSLWFAIVCGIVLLIACANVANLILARAVQRRREIAVRLALGAGRARLARQFLTESLVLAALGGVAALLVAVWLGPALRFTLLPQGTGPILDHRVLVFAGAVVLLTVVLAGLFPALQASAPDLSAALKTGAREGSVPRSATRMSLLVGQVALALLLLTGAGLFLSSLRNVRHRPVGFDAPHLIAASVDLGALGYDRADIDASYAGMRERLLRVPGVAGVSLTVGSPFGSGFGIGLAVPGLDSLPRTGIRFVQAVSPDYFRTVGTRVLRGRGFTEADAAGAPRVAVVNAAMAHDLFPAGDALGRCLKIGRSPAPCFEVVGVVENSVRATLTERPTMQYFVPLAQNTDSMLRSSVTALLVRTAGPAEGMVAAVRREMQASVANLPYPEIDPFPEVVGRLLAPWRRGSLLLGLFGGLGLLLAAVGLYGVLSYLVSQRTQELGIRIALGAQRAELLRLVVGQGLRVALLGVLLGGCTALVAGNVVASLLYGVSPRNPFILAGVALVLMTIAAIASYLPARRATQVDPMVALRYE